MRIFFVAPAGANPNNVEVTATPSTNPGNDSRHLKVSVPLPKSLFPGLFSGKMRNNSQDSEMPPSLPFPGEIPVLLLQFWPSVSNFWQEIFSRFVPQIGLKYFFFNQALLNYPSQGPSNTPSQERAIYKLSFSHENIPFYHPKQWSAQHADGTILWINAFRFE